MSHNKELGNKGEEIAVQFLKNKGYSILERNWIFDHKEIDIIALFKGTLIFVEVKTRSTNFFGEPFEFVDEKKQEFLIEAASNYVIEKNIDIPVRFDIISILLNKNRKPEITHLEDVF
jgi:putative endonuclease